MDIALSVVIPTLDAAGTLDRLLEELAHARAEGLALEVVVADGGSADGTVFCAHRHGARVIAGPSGRGTQLAAGADAARGAWLFFLHADTRPGLGWTEAARRFMAAPENTEHAAAFRIALDDPTPQARRIEALVAWRCRVFGLAYGDQGLLISRARYRALGGYAPVPVMEDVDLVRRIGRAHLILLDVPAVTSAARYRRDGWILRPLRNLLCLALYFLGVPPRALARLYGMARR